MSGIPNITHALSVREPWAWALTTGIKSVENRTWPFPAGRHPLPAWIAIHASLSYDYLDDDSYDICCVHPMIGPAMKDDRPGRSFGRSEIVGVVKVVACFDQTGIDDEPMTDEVADRITAAIAHPMSCRMASEIDVLEWPCGDGFAWVIGDCYRFLRPIVCIGRLNVWSMPSDLQRMVATELKAAMAVQSESIDRGRPFDASVVHQLPKVSKKQLAIYE